MCSQDQMNFIKFSTMNPLISKLMAVDSITILMFLWLLLPPTLSNVFPYSSLFYCFMQEHSLVRRVNWKKTLIVVPTFYGCLRIIIVISNYKNNNSKNIRISAKVCGVITACPGTVQSILIISLHLRPVLWGSILIDISTVGVTTWGTERCNDLPKIRIK